MTLNKRAIALTLIAVALTSGAIGFLIAQPICDWLSTIGALAIGAVLLVIFLFALVWSRTRR